jgi:phosphate starvation-inducible protein PhoH
MRNKETRKPTRTKRPARKTSLTLKQCSALTENQALMFESNKHVVAHGSAGTGKTFVATYLALEDIIRKQKYSNLMYIRSAVPTRNMGFLPGTDKEKAEVYEQPYKEIAFDLFDDVNAYDKLKTDGIIRFITTSFIRGTTLNDAVIIVDECQNMSMHELDSIITRVGENCRIFFCGDMFQKGDLGKEESGLGEFYDILKRMNEFDFIDFKIEDVVRGPLVKSYLTARWKG